jgi:hypothetical protein
MAEKKYMKVNGEKKVITIDKAVKPTDDDKNLLNIYVQNGYTIRYKSEKRAAAAAERAKKTGFGKKKAAAPAAEE